MLQQRDEAREQLVNSEARLKQVIEELRISRVQQSEHETLISKLRIEVQSSKHSADEVRR